MKLSLLTLLSTIAAALVQNESMDKRGWITNIKIAPEGEGVLEPVNRVVGNFKVILGTEYAKQFRYRLRFEQADTSGTYKIRLFDRPDNDGIVRFYTPIFTPMGTRDHL